MRVRTLFAGLVAVVVVAGAACTPPPPAGTLDAVAIDAGNSHTCAVIDDGTISCWGNNYSRQLGPGSLSDSSVPVTVTGLSGAAAISAGSSHSCALIDDDTARCWGGNNNGQLGNGTFLFPSAVPVTVTGLSGAVVITTGGAHSCALIDDGTARCWGYGTTRVSSATAPAPFIWTVPVTVAGLSGAVAIDAGGRHSCAVLVDGTARCWGYNVHGQLGDGTVTSSSLPVTVTGLSGAVAIDAASDHSCALLDDGTARCWGYNNHGQLGDGTTTDSRVPVEVSGLSGAVAITAGRTHSCALIDDGTVRCWGNNLSGSSATAPPPTRSCRSK